MCVHKSGKKSFLDFTTGSRSLSARGMANASDHKTRELVRLRFSAIGSEGRSPAVRLLFGRMHQANLTAFLLVSSAFCDLGAHRMDGWMDLAKPCESGGGLRHLANIINLIICFEFQD